MDRALASIQRVLALEPIPDADRIEAATILGWRVIVKKGEFKVNDLCVFFEIDSLIPFNPWVEFLDKKGTKGPIRLRTVKMKKQISQGLALPTALVPQLSVLPFFTDGQDLTELLGVTKYEAPFKYTPAHAIGCRPSWIAKTDETRVQSVPWVLELMQGRDVYITQKLDGSSLSVARHAEFGDVVCSRNLQIKLDVPGNFTNAGNDLLKKMPVGFLIQGELVGPGIQDNRLGLAAPDFFCFNVYDLSVPGGQQLGFKEMGLFCREYGIKTVPLCYVGPFEFKTVDELLAFAEIGTYPNGFPQEGVVIRPTTPENHHKLGMLSFKAVSNKFLLKIGE